MLWIQESGKSALAMQEQPSLLLETLNVTFTVAYKTKLSRLSCHGRPLPYNLKLSQVPHNIIRTVLYYPLRPYFVLFCNVVATSDAGDFELMEEFVKTLVQAPNPTPSAKRLQRLCSALVRLCRPLVHRATGLQVPDTATRNETTVNRITNQKTSEEPQRHGGMFRDGDIGEGGTGASSPNRTGTWLQQILHDDIATAAANRASITFGDINDTGTNLEDDMFNALFDVQPSLDWLGSDLFDEGSGSWGFGGSFDMP